jgi:hypothetical protein
VKKLLKSIEKHEKCKKCGNIETYTQRKTIHVGLYCSKCHKWIKWIKQDSNCKDCMFYELIEHDYICNFENGDDDPKDINVKCLKYGGND